MEIDCTGKMVCPGLIDAHLHLFTRASDEGIPPDLCLLPNGITSAVDGGTAGVSTYDAFHQINVQNSYSSIKAYINVSSLGMLHARFFENTNVEDYEPQRILEKIQQYRGEIIALKLRYSLDLNPQMPVQALDRCLEIAEQAGLPLVVHVTNPPVDMGEIAAALRPGDVFCHCFQGKGNTIIGADGRGESPRFGKPNEEACCLMRAMVRITIVTILHRRLCVRDSSRTLFRPTAAMSFILSISPSALLCRILCRSILRWECG